VPSSGWFHTPPGGLGLRWLPGVATRSSANNAGEHDPAGGLAGAPGITRGARDRLRGFPPVGAAALAAGLVLAVAVCDVFTGPGVDLTLLYLVPVGIGTFYAGFGTGTGLALLASALGIATSHLAGERLGPGVLAWNAAQQLGVFLVMAGVLDAFKRRLLHEQQAARTDPLTDLANRRAFVEAVWVELERARRHGRPISLLYLDCDDFKAVNDRLGHGAGDAVLSSAGTTLRDAVRGHDTVARLGGDEFGILLPDVDAVGAAALADRLRTRLRESLAAGGWEVTFSIGVATFLRPPSSVDEMILRADELMYRAKRSGKDGWRAGTWGAAETAA
jgi:diguanylate cyclase (GGDEF)-like protein